MAKVSVLNVAVLENPSPFHSPFRFEISFECNEALTDGLHPQHMKVPKLWVKLELQLPAYTTATATMDPSLICDLHHSSRQRQILNPLSSARDQTSNLMADAPNPSLIPETDAVGVTVVLITCTYHGQEFIRVGYYVNNEYPNPELRENPPLKPDFSQLQRNILASNPRVTRFHINWDNNTDRLEAIENQDPALGCGFPLSCTPIKGLGLPGCIPGLLPENSMDCI